MPLNPASITNEIGIALSNLEEAATDMLTPTVRIGVSGLSGAGKTVFITALIHNLLTNASLPAFSVQSEGRFIGAKLSEHPKQTIARFAYEEHLAALCAKKPHWPKSTNRISQIRLTLKYQSNIWLNSRFGTNQINIDIIDYPGEWLLDLPLLDLSFAQWSKQALERTRRASSKNEASEFLKALEKTNINALAEQKNASLLASSFTNYLKLSRNDTKALSALPPGRFLLAGDLEGSPALTFSPLPVTQEAKKSNSLYATFERRYEAYKSEIVKPFFRDHFAKLDRQIVLVDSLRHLNAGYDAVNDLETALSEILECFHVGSSNPFLQLISPKIEKILFATTKADHIHHSSHDRLQRILAKLIAKASKSANYKGAQTHSLAISSLRATHENIIKENGETLNTIIGTPQKGEKLGKQTYDGKTQIALFPGDLPKTPDSIFKADSKPISLKFLRFLPPKNLKQNKAGEAILPYIRLDSAIEYLIGDKMK